jgi:hypothetical protein
MLPVLYLASLVLSVVAGLWVEETDFLVLVWIMMSTALLVVTLKLVIQRFRNNFLKDEGYLMFTLPVPLWQLVASKALAALCAFLAVCVVIALSVLISWSIAAFSTMPEVFTSLLSVLKAEYGGKMLAWAVLFLLLIVQQLFLIYACMTVSQIAPRFRGLVGFAVYLAVMLLAESPLSSLVYNALAEGTLKFWITALLEAFFAAVYFITSVKLLKHTLNLE